MHADTRGRRAGDSHAGENDYGEMAERASRKPRATWPASARRRASARVRSCADTACRGTSARRPAGPEVPAPPGLAAPRRPGRCRVAGDCLVALLAAESAEVAYDEPGARAEGIAKAPGPGPPVDAASRPRGVRVPRAGGWAASRGTDGRSCAGLSSRVPGSSRGATRRAARGGGTPVPLAIRKHARACSGRLLGRRRELASRGPVPREANTCHGRRDGAHAAPRRQGRAGGRRAGRGEVRAARAAVSADMGLRAGTSVSQRSSGTQVRICHRRLTKNFREDGHCLLTVFGSYEGHC